MTLEMAEYKSGVRLHTGTLARRAFTRARWRTITPGTLAEHPPSPMLRRTRTLGPFSGMACFTTGTAARTEPRHPMAGGHISTGTLAEHPPSPRLRRTRTLGPALTRRGVFHPGHGGADGAAPSHGGGAQFLRAPWPSRRSALGTARVQMLLLVVFIFA